MNDARYDVGEVIEPNAKKSKDHPSSSSTTIVSLTENRSKEVGLATFNLKDGQLILSQYSDTQTYVHTHSKLFIFEPAEVILPETSDTDLGNFVRNIADAGGFKVTPIKRKCYSETEGQLLVRKLVIPQEKASVELNLTAKHLACAAAAALIRYVESIQAMSIAECSLRVILSGCEGSMMMDAETIKNLELVSNQRSGNRAHTLFGILNNTKTVQGQRMLVSNLVQPSSDLATIIMRLDAVEELLQNERMFYNVTAVLSGFLDISHLLGQLVQIPNASDSQSIRVKHSQRAISNVLLMKHTVEHLPKLIEALSNCRNPLFLAMIGNFEDQSFVSIREDIDRVINEGTRKSKNLAAMQAQVCFAVKSSINGMLDVARKTYSETTEDIQSLLQTYREEFGLTALRLQNNARRGYFLSIPSAGNKVSDLPAIFIQTGTSGKKITFSSEALISLSGKIRESQNEILGWTNVVVGDLLGRLRKHLGALYKLAESVALLDMLQSFATYVTLSDGCVRPDFTTGTAAATGPIAIKQGRHPIMERLNPQTFVANDTFLNDTCNFQVITGPNMAGKSTYLRQNALLCIMAQVGCYVPARYASFPIIERLFTRIGTGDCIETNSSSFMNEMREMNFILQNAGDRSLVIIDELGRGTSNADGSSIAFAICEEMATSRTGCYTLFATHYQELTMLEKLYYNVQNFHLVVERPARKSEMESSKMRFTYVLNEGKSTETRYGIDMGEMAGLSVDIIERARRIRKHLDQKRNSTASIAENIRGENGEDYGSPSDCYALVERLLLLRNSSLDEQGIRNYLTLLKNTFVVMTEDQ